MKTLKYYRKNVFGNDLRYLSTETEQDRVLSDAIARLLKKKTIDISDMKSLEILDLEFKETFAP